MTYNDLLLQLFYVVCEINKKENPNYVPSKLFNDMNNLLNLEKVCEDYFNRYDDLSSVELENFNNFASLDGKARRKLISDYQKAYQNNLISKIFLQEYSKIGDYIAAIFLNEMKDNFFSKTFVRTFNDKIRKVYTEDETLLSIFKMQSYNYKALKNKKEDLGILFMTCLKEFEMLTKVYMKNGLDGVISINKYDAILRIVDMNNSIIENENWFLAMDEYERYNNIEKFIENDRNLEVKENSVAKVFLKLENSKRWFTNKYLDLVLTMTDINSELYNAFDDDSLLYFVGVFINYLSNEDFLNAVTKKVNDKIEFKDLSSLIEKLKKYKLNILKKDISEMEKRYSCEGIKKVLEEVADGKIKIEDTNLEGKKKL